MEYIEIEVKEVKEMFQRITLLLLSLLLIVVDGPRRRLLGMPQALQAPTGVVIGMLTNQSGM